MIVILFDDSEILYIFLWTLKLINSWYIIAIIAINVIHLEPRFSVYAWYIQRIFHVYAVLTDIHHDGIYVVYPWIYRGPWISKYHGYLTEWIYMVYPWIYHVYRPSSIYLVYSWIYMVYHLTYIHGIYVVTVYPWIFLDF